MTGELQIDSSAFSGSTLYALLYNDSGQVYDVPGANFEDFVAAQIGNYDIPLTEQGPGAGYFRADMPTALAGLYTFAVRLQAGGVPAITDLSIGASEAFYWDGAAIVSAGDLAQPGDAMALTAGERTTTAAVFLTQLLEGVHTVGDGLRIMLAALAGKSTGGGTFTNRFRDVADSKNRIDATVDANGNRSAISIDGT